MIYLGLAVAAVMAALSGFGWFEHERASMASNRADAAELKLDAAQKRASALALLWAAQVDKTDAEVAKQRESDHVEITGLEQRVAALSAAPTLRYSADAWRLWSDAVSFARDAPAAPEVVASGAAAVPAFAISEQDDIDFKVAAAAAYKSAVGLFHECRNFYLNLRKEGQP